MNTSPFGAYNLRVVPEFRAAGGYIRKNKLYRSDALHELTDTGRRVLAGVGTVIDLREPDESERAPSALHTAVTVITRPVFAGADPSRLLHSGSSLTLHDLYAAMVDDHGTAIAAAVGHIADSGGAGVLVHCTAGKDRTGIVVALALAAVGVADDDIADDYARSHEHLRGEWTRRLLATSSGYRGITHEDLEEFASGSSEQYIRGALARIQIRHGGPAQYLLAHGMSEDTIRLLRHTLVNADNPAPVPDVSTPHPAKEQQMTDTTTPADIRDFRVEIAQQDLDGLRDRLRQARWPHPVAGDQSWQRGVPSDVLRRIADYWLNSFDWRAQERQLNTWPQFVTEIDGLDIHFIHARSPRPDATPLLLLHGWPGSVAEFLKIISPLTDPDAHGAPGAPAFHIVAPSLPGFGFTSVPRTAGWGLRRIASSVAELMERLGYDRYGVQGGDWGAILAPIVARVASDHVTAIHVNAATVGFSAAGPVGEDELTTLTAWEQQRLAIQQRFTTESNAYASLQGTRPQTIAYALHDSPIGQLAWITEKFHDWSDPARELPDEAVDIDQLLTNVSIYWFTGTAGSAANLYYEAMQANEWTADRTDTPVGVATFAGDYSVRRFAEVTNNVVHWTTFDVGGHFAAMETPALLVDDVRAFFPRHLVA